MESNLLKIIESRFDGLSKGQKSIARYILDHYEKAAYMTAAKLGMLVKVSESTVVRFANELGFDGYPALQSALRELVRTNLTSFQRVEVSDSIIGDRDVLEQVLLSDAEKIRRTLDAIDRRAFDEAVDKIINANRIYIIGVRSSATLAGFLRYDCHQLPALFQKDHQGGGVCQKERRGCGGVDRPRNLADCKRGQPASYR